MEEANRKWFTFTDDILKDDLDAPMEMEIELQVRRSAVESDRKSNGTGSSSDLSQKAGNHLKRNNLQSGLPSATVTSGEWQGAQLLQNIITNHDDVEPPSKTRKKSKNKPDWVKYENDQMAFILKTMEKGIFWKDVPDFRKKIYNRGTPPAHCQIKSGLHLRQTSLNENKHMKLVERKFLELAGNVLTLPASPDLPSSCGTLEFFPVQNKKPVLSEEERNQVNEQIKFAGDKGIPIDRDGYFLVWKEGKGQQFVDQVGLGRRCKIAGKETLIFHPVCTEEGCFETRSTRRNYEEAKCAKHQPGAIKGYLLCRMEKKESTHTTVEFRVLHYYYTPENHSSCIYEVIKARSAQIEQEFLSGIEHFSTEEELNKRIAVCTSAAMLVSLVDPKIVFCGIAALANGLEGEVEQEMSRYGWELEAVKMNVKRAEIQNISVPFGRRVTPDTKIYSVIEQETGFLYLMYDDNVHYGGQTILSTNNLHNPLYSPMDSVARYKLGSKSLKRIPICIVEKKDLLKMESLFIASLFIGYLLNMRSPFNLTNHRTKPYLLNKEINTGLFGAGAWNKIQQFLMREYGFGVIMRRIEKGETIVKGTGRLWQREEIKPWKDNRIASLSHLQCSTCQIYLATTDLLAKHIKDVHEPRPWSCTKCPKRFKSKINLNDHTRRVHATAKFGCESCGKLFKTRDKLKTHQLRIHSSIKFSCRNCTSVFATHKELDTHKSKIHPIDQEHVCPVCDYSCSLYGNLVQHLKIHNANEPRRGRKVMKHI